MAKINNFLIADNKPITQAFLNRYFGNFTYDFMLRLEKIHKKHNEILVKSGIQGSRFVDMAYDYYQRYQQIYNISTITPVDKKSMKYIEGFMNETISKIKKMYKKHKLTGSSHELLSIIESVDLEKRTPSWS